MAKYMTMDGKVVLFDDPNRAVWYGNCGYYTDDWDKLTKVGPGIPACPKCKRPGYYVESYKWWEGVQKFNDRAGEAGYFDALVKHKEKCYAHFEKGWKSVWDSLKLLKGNRVFLSSRYSRKGELLHLRTLLQLNGFEVCSRWLDTEWTETEREGEVYSSAAPPERREEYAQIDRDDVAACNVFIGFTEAPRSSSRGGRHVEFGIAVALKKKIIIVGPRENIFHSLPEVKHLHESVDHLHILNVLKEVVKA